MPRGSGKTTLLIKESAKTGSPIVVSTRRRVDNIVHMANDMKLKNSRTSCCVKLDEWYL